MIAELLEVFCYKDITSLFEICAIVFFYKNRFYALLAEFHDSGVTVLVLPV